MPRKPVPGNKKGFVHELLRLFCGPGPGSGLGENGVGTVGMAPPPPLGILELLT